jgi:hypothetical protein
MQEQQQPTPALFSTKLPTKSQTYFFDVKAAKNGSKYLTITQSRIKDGQKFRNSVIVFSDQLEAFSQIFEEAKQQAV